MPECSTQNLNLLTKHYPNHHYSDIRLSISKTGPLKCDNDPVCQPLVQRYMF